jgi:signal peptidase II
VPGSKIKRKGGVRMTCLCIAAAVFWLDFLVKNLAEKHLDGKERKELGKTGFFLQLAHNRGFAKNRLEDHPELVKKIQGGLLSLFGLYGLVRLFFQEGKKIAALGMALILGGGASNFFDRIFRGHVVDYLGLPKIKKLVFNLSDLAIFLGSFLLLIGDWKEK